MPILGYGTSRDQFPNNRTVAEVQRLSRTGVPGYYAIPIPIPPISGKERSAWSWRCVTAGFSGVIGWASTNALRSLSYLPGLGGAFAGVVTAGVESWTPLPVKDGSTVPVPTWVVTLQNGEKLQEFKRQLEAQRNRGRVDVVRSSGNKIWLRFSRAENATSVAVDSVQALAEAEGVYDGVKFACGG